MAAFLPAVGSLVSKKTCPFWRPCYDDLRRNKCKFYFNIKSPHLFRQSKCVTKITFQIPNSRQKITREIVSLETREAQSKNVFKCIFLGLLILSWNTRERLVSCAQKRDHPFADLWSIYAIKMFTLAQPINCSQDNILMWIRKLFLISHKSQLQRQSKALESSSGLVGNFFFKSFKYAFTFLKYTCELHFQIFSKLGSIIFFFCKT